MSSLDSLQTLLRKSLSNVSYAICVYFTTNSEALGTDQAFMALTSSEQICFAFSGLLSYQFVVEFRVVKKEWTAKISGGKENPPSKNSKSSKSSKEMAK